MTLPRVLLVSLGGTITMTSNAGGGITPTLTGADLVEAVPALANVAEIEAVSPFRLPGSSLTFANLREVAQLITTRLANEDFAGAIVVQGTDSIEETAFLLDLVVQTERPVVVVGAMRGAQAPGADGPANLLAATVVAADPLAAGLGTVVVLNDTIHAARRVQKVSTFIPSAFESVGSGPLGHVIEGRMQLMMRPARKAPFAKGLEQDGAPVALVTGVLGDDGRILSQLPELGYAGVVVEALGAGHVPALYVEPMEALARRIPVVLSTRVAGGPVFTATYNYPGSEIDLLARGIIHGGDLGGLKSRLLLSSLLGAGLAGDELSQAFAHYSSSVHSA